MLRPSDRSRSHPSYLRPQQLPGPAQFACAGDDPQHAVSPGPGMLFLAAPDMDECAESIFLRFRLPQDSQMGASFNEATSTSWILPQS
jgi:hypothetical protein